MEETFRVPVRLRRFCFCRSVALAITGCKRAGHNVNFVVTILEETDHRDDPEGDDA